MWHACGWSQYLTVTLTLLSRVLKACGIFRSSFILMVRSPVLILVPRHVAWWGPDTISPKLRNITWTAMLSVSRGNQRTRTQVPPGCRWLNSKFLPRIFTPVNSSPVATLVSVICTSQMSLPLGMMASICLITGPREAHISSPVTKGWKAGVEKYKIVAAAVDSDFAMFCSGFCKRKTKVELSCTYQICLLFF